MIALLLALILGGQNLHAQPHAFTAIEAQREVLQYHSQTTDGRGNHGILEFLRATLRSSPHFAQLTRRYYERLRELDENLGWRTSDGVPIQEEAHFDAWSLALELSGQDPHRALLMMLIYGHDNMENLLSRFGSEALFNELDRIRPLESSVLYRNAAIPALRYSTEDVESGQRIARACRQIFLRGDEQRLCNDYQEHYQADYYHVIASAYLACRARIRGQGAGYALALRAQLVATRAYKLLRFTERLHQIQSHQTEGSPALELVNRYLIAHAATGASLQLPSYSSMIISRWFRGLSERDYLAAQAILNRYDFELGFRARQHEMGFRFGWQVCGGQQSLELQ